MTDQSARRRAFRFGRLGETMAAWALRLKGYRILASRFKTPVGEIDLVACRSSVLVFVEVKSRRGQGVGEQPVSPKQQRRITRAAQAFVQQNQTFADYDMRFDLVLVRPWALPRQIRGAWRMESQQL